MSLKLFDIADASYTLPNTFMITGMPVTKRVSLSARTFSHGAVNAADQKYDARIITINGVLNDTSDASFLATKNTIFKWLHSAVKLKFNSDNHYVNVSLARIAENYQQGRFLRIGEFAIELLCEDPFIYEDTEQHSQKSITSSPDTLNVTVNGNVESFPRILVVNSADNHALELENTTLGQSLNYDDTLFDNGQTLTVDCDAGTVLVGSANRIYNMTGQFLSLAPGSNTIQYTGANCTLHVYYRNRYL